MSALLISTLHSEAGCHCNHFGYACWPGSPKDAHVSQLQRAAVMWELRMQSQVFMLEAARTLSSESHSLRWALPKLGVGADH